ncbi:uncharacterized protein PSFLO_07705 [Pseudozyma flocculosa]|uniref:Uncharacterized protein n=1 Tax=Pseudozyma flocculosa TaxID=84751 RepID=A0A5C3FCT4_9BASI|nr:uncharacterized protein PSFLO_07705 [Pseudozyma flocculosa]
MVSAIATANTTAAPPSMKAENFVELIRLEATDEPNVFLTCSFPEKQGNSAAIAYGGCTLAFVVQAAYKTVEGRKGLPDFNIYSLNGNYLGPALSDRRVRLKVDIVRDTRTFATRFVTAYQTWDNGQERSCFAALIDFQAPVPKPAEPLKASTIVQRPEDVPSWRDVIDERVRTGGLTPQRARGMLEMFELGMRLGESRQVPTSIHYQNMIGNDTSKPTTQDHLALTDRVSVDWFRCRVDLGPSSSALPPPPGGNSRALPVSAKSANACFLAFTMDAAIAFIPVTYSNIPLDAVGACSSLDCAFRYHTEAPDMNKWHLREMKTICGQAEKTYSEARLWDEELGMVATMTQASILRSPPPPPPGRKEQARL